VYFQFAFAFDEVKRLAPEHPEWKTKEPFSFILAGDMKGLLALGNKGLLEIIMATHSGMTTEEFAKTVEFMRVFAEQTYGIPPEQVVGSSGVVKFELKDGKPELLKEPKIEFIDDGPGKPVAINRFIGRRPILAFGNSDGDQQMLEYTSGGDGPRLMLLVHHTDAEREWAYDRNSPIGKLDKALDEAQTKGWTVVDMKADWKTVFPPEQ
jgi:hypothetical protein